MLRIRFLKQHFLEALKYLNPKNATYEIANGLIFVLTKAINMQWKDYNRYSQIKDTWNKPHINKTWNWIFETLGNREHVKFWWFNLEIFKMLVYDGFCFIQAGIYLLKVNNRNSRTRCEICSKSTIKTTFWCLYY